jgi:oxygen-independent coproporphyrinogen III oxidase
MHTSYHKFVSLYLHIPFCSTKCTYCDFNSYANITHLIEPFVHSIIRETKSIAEYGIQNQIGTIFLGGGTPSILASKQLESIISTIRQHFDITDNAEISIETNPGDLNINYLTDLKRIGINRLSIGMQSANPSELALFARHHNNNTIIQAVSDARALGFKNVNLDLIYGFPQQTMASWQTSLKQLLELDPEHISLYAMGIEAGTALHSWVKNGALSTLDDDLVADMYEFATEAMHKHGYKQYEISNWAKPGYSCRHNLQYWRNLQYIGIGPGAHGFAGGVRYANILSPREYIRALHEYNQDKEFRFPYTPATDNATIVGRADEIAETLMMSLRLTEEGVQREIFRERFGIDLLDIHGEILRRFTNQGLLEITPNRVRLTKSGRLLSNMIIRELI